jgi:glycosyltransferase involved in cell wall biosynthesis
VSTPETTRERPLVSAIVPVHDGARFLAAALESALAQDYEPLEIVVVDDGSTDGSGEIAQRYPVRLSSQPHLGVAAARNAGLAVARGELIAWLDADDLWTPDKLTVQVGYLREHPETDYVIARGVAFLEPGIEQPGWLGDEWLDEGGVGLPTIVARRQVFDLVGPFDEAYSVGEDLDWVQRARQAGVEERILPDVVLRYRVHDGNASHGTSLGVVFQVMRGAAARRRGAAIG